MIGKTPSSPREKKRHWDQTDVPSGCMYIIREAQNIWCAPSTESHNQLLPHHKKPVYCSHSPAIATNKALRRSDKDIVMDLIQLQRCCGSKQLQFVPTVILRPNTHAHAGAASVTYSSVVVGEDD